MSRIRIVIIGAAGRDFHNFNVVYREDDRYEVVAFTAAQIPNIHGRRYPPLLAGRLYPDGIPIVTEAELPEVIRRRAVQEAIFSYSDVSNQQVMRLGALVNASGADFRLLAPAHTMLKSSKPVVAVCAVRTGAGKSQTTRKVAALLHGSGLRVVAVRHPMPYGDLAAQRVQRFADLADLARHKCTIEEMEEYEPHIASGTTVYAGVDYGAILEQAQEEADVVLWDGGNNDLPFYRPDLHIVVADPLRAGHELAYYPSEANLRMAHAVIINKVDSGTPEAVEQIHANIRAINPSATVIEAASPVGADDPALLTGKRVLVIEDGPTVTHGEMPFGAGVVLARKYGAAEIVDPRPHAVGSIAKTFAQYPGVQMVLPAMGYGDEQVRELEATIARVPCDAVVIGTPIDLRRVIRIGVPSVRVRYDLQEIGKPDLDDVLAPVMKTARHAAFAAV